MDTLRVLSLVLLIGSLANCDRQQDIEKSDEYSLVVKFDDAIEFQNAVTSNNAVYFVMFYIPWCDFCEQLKPAFNELALRFNPHNSMENPVISEIDCSKLSAICDRLSVESYPTLLMFSNGLDSPATYDGPHSFEHLVNFTKQYRKQRSERKPVELSRKAFEAMDPSDIQFVMYYSPTCAHCEAALPEWKKLAADVATNLEGVFVSQVNCEVEREMCVNQGVVSFPTFVLYKDGQMQDKYDGPRDIKTFTDYLISMKNELSNQVHIPIETDHQAVVVLDNENVDKVLKSGFVFVNFYKPWCSFCQTLHPKWNQLANKHGRSGFVTIASVDCAVQDTLCNKYGIVGYPTLLLFRKGLKQTMYTGVHEFEALSQFVAHQTNQKEL